MPWHPQKTGAHVFYRPHVFHIPGPCVFHRHCVFHRPRHPSTLTPHYPLCPIFVWRRYYLIAHWRFWIIQQGFLNWLKVFMEIGWRFLIISQRLSVGCSFLIKFWIFTKIAEDLQRPPKNSEVFQGRSKDVSTISLNTLSSSGTLEWIQTFSMATVRTVNSWPRNSQSKFYSSFSSGSFSLSFPMSSNSACNQSSNSPVISVWDSQKERVGDSCNQNIRFPFLPSWILHWVNLAYYSAFF